MSYTTYSLITGEITGAFTSDDESLIYNVPTGDSVVLGDYNHLLGYIVEGQFVEYSAEQVALKAQRPPHRASWSNSAMAWVDERNLEQVRADRWEAVKAARAISEFSPITVDGNTYDADQDSQIKIAGSVQAASLLDTAFSTDWTLADNSVVTLTGPQMIAVGLAVAARTSRLFWQARALRTQIAAAATIEGVLAVVWPSP